MLHGDMLRADALRGVVVMYIGLYVRSEEPSVFPAAGCTEDSGNLRHMQQTAEKECSRGVVSRRHSVRSRPVESSSCSRIAFGCMYVVGTNSTV